MYTSIIAVALAAFFQPAVLDTPQWVTDYSTGRQLGRTTHKPLAVIIGSGKTGWDQLSRDGKLNSEVNRVLAREYVCVYVDIDKNAGHELAEAFEVADAPALIISDATGGLQAYRHEGDLSNGDLVHFLKRYADPARRITSTEGDTQTRVSYYQPAAEAPSLNYYQPVFTSGRSC